MYRDHSVAVVMPIYNEQDHLMRAISRVPAYVDTIVAVDDGSTDGTWERLSEIGHRDIIRLHHSSNRGVGAATKTGYGYLLETGTDLIAVMDGDGQMDGRDLSGLLDRAIAGADYVKGNRFLHRETIRCMPIGRYIGNRIFSWLTRRAAMLEIGLDAQCGYTVIRRSALKRLDLNELYDRYGFPNEMLFAAARNGFTVETAPVRCIYDDEISGINPLTAVPTITWLIARSYLRRKLALSPGPGLLTAQEGESNSGN